MTNTIARHDLQTEHYDAVDLMKYLCALMVVVIHCKPFLPYSAFWNVMTAEGVCRISVPFFFAVSGVFLNKKLCRYQCEGDHGARMKLCAAYSLKNAKLYLSWSVVYIVLHAITNRTVEWTFAAEQCRMLIFDASHYHFWYLLALIYAAPWVSKLFLLKRKSLIGIITAGRMVQSIRFVYRWIPGGDTIPWTTRYWDALMNTAFCAVPMLCLGALCWQDHKKATTRQWFLRTGISFTVTMGELVLLYVFSPQKTHFEFLLTMPFLTYSLVCWLLNVRFAFSDRFVPHYLREGSIWIYCVHPLWISLFGFFDDSTGLRRFAVVTVLVLLSSFIYVTLKFKKRRNE